VNQHTNEALTNAIKYMNTKEYRDSRDTTDVIPTHRHLVEPPKPKDRFKGIAVYDPVAEKMADKAEAAGDIFGDDDDDDDDELEALRAIRMRAIKQHTAKQAEWQAKGHSTYREIGQDQFFQTVVRDKGGSERAAVQFFNKDFELCKVMDKHLQELCVEMPSVKFVKCDVEKSPFLTERLRVTVLPCIVIFKDDIAVDRIVGFDNLAMNAKGDDIEPASLRERFEIAFNTDQMPEGQL
jgi:thiol-disulfide isomerase/thioredoxin